MVLPIRPHDASGIYRQQALSSAANGIPAADEQTADARRPGATTRRADRVSISDDARSLQRILHSVTDTPAERDAVIEQLRSQIADGTYRLDPRAVAERMVEEGWIA